jgi:hypothetical protein
LTLEYLLNVQDSLASHCESLETQCGGLAEECQSLETENHKIEGEIAALKKEIRQKQSTLATFEVMLLNATAAKRGSQALRTMQQQEILDQENDPAVLNILGASATPDDESGAVAMVSSCVLCGKKFVSPEYLVRHQHKKHTDVPQRTKKQQKKKRDTSSSEDSSRSGSESETTKKKKSREPKTAPLPAEVVQALHDRNELSKQLRELQCELQTEKEKRANDAKQAEHQQAQLATQLTHYMATLQTTLVEIEKKQEQSKHEMMRFTQEALERERQETAKKSHAGRLESDDDSPDRDFKKGTSPEEMEKRILDSLLRAQAEIHHKNAELEQANRKLQTKLRRKTRQLQMDPQPMPTALMSMAAIDAQRFGVDPGLLEVEEKPRARPTPHVVVEDKRIQTDDEQENAQRKKAVTMSQLVQTDVAPVKESIAKPKSTPAVRQPPPPAKRQEEVKLPTPSEPRQAISKLTATPVVLPIVESPSPPPMVPTEERTPESKLQHAAHVVGKVALGFLARKTLQNPSNWLVTLPRALLSHTLSKREFEALIESHGGTLQDVTVEIEPDMTATDLRIAFAEALSGVREHEEEETTDNGMIDYHRVLLHDRRTGQEIRGDHCIHHLRSQLDVEIIPSFEAAEAHVDHIITSHKATSDRLEGVRRASMEFAPVGSSLPIQIQGRESIAIRAAIRVQTIVRRFLAVRHVEMLKIDRLVEARLVAMRSLTSSPRSRSLSSQRLEVPRSASVAVIQKELADETVVTEHAQRIHARLADLVKQKTGIDTRTKSAKWSRGQLSTEDYTRHVQEMEQHRATLAPAVQQRIAEISDRVDQLLQGTYDPFAAKQEEVEYVAANRIQLAVQVALARRKLQQLLGRNEDTAQIESDSQPPTLEKDTESASLPGDDKSENEVDGKEEEEEKQVETDDDDVAQQVDVEELDDDLDIKRLADAYEHGAESKAQVIATPAKPDPLETKPPPVEAKPALPPRAGTPPPSREDLLGRSPRPKGDVVHAISPFSSTPLLSRRAATTRRGSGYDNAR